MATNEQLERLRNFAAPAYIAVVATIGKDGMPHLTPNWYACDHGRILVSTTKQRVKCRNIARDPRMAVSIYSEPMAHDYVTASGQAQIVEGDEIWPLTKSIIQRYVKPDKVSDRLAQMRKEDRVILAMTPERVFFRYG